MQTTHGLLTALRFLLGLAFTALAVAQVVVLPAVFGRWSEESPDLAHLRWPMLTVSVLVLLCVQVVIVCTWRLLTMVQEGSIFSEDSFTWVNAILAAVAAGWVLLLGTFVSVVDLWGRPGLQVALLLMLVGGAVLGLLIVVMRALLRQATTLRADLEAVI